MKKKQLATDLLETIKSQSDVIAFCKDWFPVREYANYATSAQCPCGAKSAQTKDAHCKISKDFLYCFVCAKSFDIFALVMQRDGVNFVEAKQRLCKDLGIETAQACSKIGTQLFIDESLVQEAVRNPHNNFTRFCRQQLGISIDHLISWGVGTFQQKYTVFFQKDITGRTWNYQAIDYNERCKKVGTVFSASQPVGGGYYNTMLFGMHLLRASKHIPIVVVESPKTAVIASWFYPDYDFVACMSANGLSEFFCQLLIDTGKPIYWLADADGNEMDDKGVFLGGGRYNSSITRLQKMLPAHSFVIDLFPEYRYVNQHIHNRYHYDIADYLIEHYAAIKARKIGLPALLSEEKVFTTTYWTTYVYAKPTTQSIEFWYKYEGKMSMQLMVVANLYIDFLVYSGFCYVPHHGKKVLVRVENNIVDYADFKDIKDFVVEYIKREVPKVLHRDGEKILTSNTLLNIFLSSPSHYFGESLLSTLPTIADLDFLHDEPNCAYKFYRNGVVVIKPHLSQYEIIPYSSLGDHKVWRHQIIDRDFVQLSPEAYLKSNFYSFLCLTQFDDDAEAWEEAKKNLFLSIGYLLHSYKTQHNTKLIVAIDKGSNHTDKGGTGKSIVFYKAIKQIVPVAYQDGKTWDTQKDTCFDFLKDGERVACINDLAENFNIEVLYNAITDDIKIRTLYATGKTLVFEDSPKFVVITNFVIEGEDYSDHRRLHFVTFGSFFKEHETTPDRYYKETFFQTWTAYQWQMFDNLMLSFLQQWLEVQQLPSTQQQDYKTKKMIETLSEDELLRLDSLFKPNGEWATGIRFNRNDICNHVYPPEERGYQTMFACQKRLKKVLTIYFSTHSNEVQLQKSKHHAPYATDGIKYYIEFTKR